MLRMLCYVSEDSQTNTYIKHTCKYLLILFAKNTTADEFQQLSNQAKIKTKYTRKIRPKNFVP